MKSFRSHTGEKKKRGGFSLTEVTFSIGVLSFGLLSLGPLLVLGLKAAHQARDERACSQIAQGLIEQAKQGTLGTGTLHLDDQGNVLNSTQTSAFTAQTSSQTASPSAALTKFTLTVMPSGAPDRARVYAVVFQTPASAAH